MTVKVVCVAVVLFLLSATYLDFRIMPNQSSRALPVMTLVEDGELRIDKYHGVTEDKSLIDGHYYSDKAPLSSWMTLPFYAVVRPFIAHLHPEIRLKIAISLGAFVCGTMPFLATLLICLLWCRNAGAAPRQVLAVSLSLFGCLVFVYAGTFFGHLLAGLFLLLAYILHREKERHLLAGIFLGFGFLAEFPIGLAVAVWSLQLVISRRRLRPALMLWLGFCPALVVIGLYNVAVTGNPLTFAYQYIPHEAFSAMGQQYGLGMPSLAALWGMTFGAKRGLFVCSPLLLWYVVVFLRSLRLKPVRETARELASHPLVGFGGGTLLFFSSYYMWWGGWCFGPRHLIPLAVVWLYEGNRFVSRHGIHWASFAPIAVYGVCLNWMTKATHGFLIPDRYPFPVYDPVLVDFLWGRWSPLNALSGYLGTSLRLVTVGWALLFIGLVLLLLLPWKPSPKTDTDP
ncbi:hypothetical protein ACFL59_03200 [Planctomycetota bacterium]